MTFLQIVEAYEQDEIDDLDYQREVDRRDNWARQMADTEEELEALLDAIREYDGDYRINSEDW